MTAFRGTPLALPLTWEEHELSEGYSSIVYDGRGMAIDKHLSAAQAEAIARMVNAHGELLALAKLLAESLRYEIKRNERSGDDEGARLKRFTLSRVEAAIAAAEGREGHDQDAADALARAKKSAADLRAPIKADKRRRG